MLGMGLTRKQGSLGEKTLQNVAFGIFLLLCRGIATAIGSAQNASYGATTSDTRGAIHLSKSVAGDGRGRGKKVGPPTYRALRR